jgi:hypothetical protein
MLPNAFIAGAQKSGTTTLCHALEQHPQAVVSSPKEPAFFSYAANLAAPELYKENFRMTHATMPTAIIDGSNVYMVAPSVPERMRDMLGDNLRFVFCLREPVARAISGYWHQAKKGRERRTLSEVLSFAGDTIDAALCKEQEHLDRAVRDGLVDISGISQRFDDPLWNFRYLRNSLYTDDIERFASIFGADRIKVILFEELVREPHASLTSVAAFLGLDSNRFPPDLDLHRNRTALVAAPKLVTALSKIPGRTFLRRLPGYAGMRGALFFRAPPRADGALAERLRGLFAPEVRRLEARLGRDLATIWGGIRENIG